MRNILIYDNMFDYDDFIDIFTRRYVDKDYQ